MFLLTDLWQGQRIAPGASRVWIFVMFYLFLIAL